MKNNRPISMLRLGALTLCCLTLLSCKKDSEQTDAPPSSPLLQTVERLPTETITLAGQPFTIELAFRRTTRARGLMFREQLAPDAGMLFIFERSARRSFYMRNCLIDLDLVYITADATIASITTMTVPVPGRSLKHYRSDGPVKYALELPAGTAQKLGLKPGQKIDLSQRIRGIIPDPD